MHKSFHVQMCENMLHSHLDLRTVSHCHRSHVYERKFFSLLLEVVSIDRCFTHFAFLEPVIPVSQFSDIHILPKKLLCKQFHPL